MSGKVGGLGTDECQSAHWDWRLRQDPALERRLEMVSSVEEPGMSTASASPIDIREEPLVKIC